MASARRFLFGSSFEPAGRTASFPIPATMRPSLRRFRVLLLVVPVLLAGGCVLAPRDAAVEKAALSEHGRAYEAPFETRDLPELPAESTWRDVLRRAYLANGELEAAYYEWARAVHGIDREGSYPNTPLMVEFEQMLESGADPTIRLSPDSMESLSLPNKVYQAAKVATREAQAAGQRFHAAKLALRQRVLAAWVEYALQAERVRIAESNLALLRLLNQTTAGRVRAGGAQADLSRAELEERLADDELQNMRAELHHTMATLNALMARDADAPIAPPGAMLEARPLPWSDAEVLALASLRNPELAALARRVAARDDAVELARLQFLPDVNPFGGWTGTASQFVGAAVSIPTFLPELRAAMRQARAELRQAEAIYRQTRFDQAAQIVAALVALRNSERQAALYAWHVLPTAERIVGSARSSYAAGSGAFNELIEAQRTLLEVRLTLAEARAARELRLAELETLIGLEAEAAPGAQSAGEDHDHG